MKTNINVNYPSWWTKTMEYIRVVSGTVYEDSLKKYVINQLDEYSKISGSKAQNIILELEKKDADIVSFLNCYNPSTGEWIEEGNQGFLKKHPLTDEVYTVPNKRAKLDPILKNANPNYIYNAFLYQDEWQSEYAEQKGISVTEDIQSFVFYDAENASLRIDFSGWRDNPKYKEQFAVSDFHLGEWIKAAEKMGYTPIEAVELNGQGVLFLGETHLSLLEGQNVMIRNLQMSEATFQNDFWMEGLTFSCSDRWRGTIDLDFRNTRFFQDVKIRGIRLTETNRDTVMTFEDARISENFLVLNSEFEHSNLYCFQTVFGSFEENDTHHKVQIINTYFESDAQLDFVDCDIQHGIVVLENIPVVPNANLCFAETMDGFCPDLYVGFHNCEITGILNLSNIREMSFYQSRNSGKILVDSHWADAKDGFWKKRTKGFNGAAIKNKLTLAVYNNTKLCPNNPNGLENQVNTENQLMLAKAKDFIMLKENYSACGMYDAEDIAFILYMEHKPIVDTVNRGVPKEKAKPNKFYAGLYRILFLTGEYGISPLRVFWALLITVILFAAIYFGAANTIRADVQDGKLALETITSSDRFGLGNIVCDMDTTGGQIVGSVLYSLECIIPFTAQFEPFSIWICVLSALENFIGSFLIGYFSVAVVRKTLR